MVFFILLFPFRPGGTSRDKKNLTHTSRVEGGEKKERENGIKKRILSENSRVEFSTAPRFPRILFYFVCVLCCYVAYSEPDSISNFPLNKSKGTRTRRRPGATLKGVRMQSESKTDANE